jgi:hypothetical protein
VPQRKKGYVDVLPRSPRHFRVEFEHDLIETLDEAREVAGVYAILEGDHGGQTYMTVPAKLVRCDEPTLRSLLQDLDELAWNETEGQQLTFWRHRIGDHFGGGMGGADATGDVWVHKTLRALGIEDPIRKVIMGEAPRLGLSADEVNRLRADWRARH